MFINACFEGGGVKGLTYVGAIRFLEERGFRFFKVSGTSVGSIFASLISVGYTSKEIEKIIEEIDFRLVANKNTLRNGIRDRGLYSIKSLEDKLYSLFLKKGKTKFVDLKYGDDYLLKIITAEMKTKKMVIIPDDLEKYGYDKDQFLISKAVAMSCSIPLVFSQYRLNNYVFVDGGVANNFPIELVIEENRPTIGFRLNNDNSFFIKLRNKVFKLNKSFGIDNINVIYLDSLNIRAAQFKKGFLMKKELYTLGYIITKNFFETER